MNNGSCNQMATGNMTIGQCYCKSNFTGRQCNQCVDGFYGVTVAPIGQCKGKGLKSINLGVGGKEKARFRELVTILRVICCT